MSMDYLREGFRAVAAANLPGERHPDADRSMVSVERSDVIDAAAGLALMARENRRAAKLRQNAGPANANHRAWLRQTADVYDAAAKRMQDAANAAL